MNYLSLRTTYSFLTLLLISRLVLDRVAIPESALLGASPSKRRRKSSPVTLRVATARTPPKRESPSKRARPTHPRRRSLIRDNLDYQSSRRRLLETSDEDPPALERTDQMSPRYAHCLVKIFLCLLTTGMFCRIHKTTRIMIYKGMVYKSKYWIFEKNKGVPVSKCRHF